MSEHQFPEGAREQGSDAAKSANDRRDEIRQALSDGSMTLEEVFTEVEAESERHLDNWGDERRVLGHMHLRSALLALPHIGEKKADAILEGLGLEGDRHLAMVGTDQQAALIQEVIDHSPHSAGDGE